MLQLHFLGHVAQPLSCDGSTSWAAYSSPALSPLGYLRSSGNRSSLSTTRRWPARVLRSSSRLRSPASKGMQGSASIPRPRDSLRRRRRSARYAMTGVLPCDAPKPARSDRFGSVDRPSSHSGRELGSTGRRLRTNGRAAMRTHALSFARSRFHCEGAAGREFVQQPVASSYLHEARIIGHRRDSNTC
jgi:hypothetical protein